MGTYISVVPAALFLLVLQAAAQGGGRRVKFGTRVQQAKSLCSDFSDCKFGYKFDEKHSERSRNIVFVSPRVKTDLVTSPLRGRSQGTTPPRGRSQGTTTPRGRSQGTSPPRGNSVLIDGNSVLSGSRDVPAPRGGVVINEVPSSAPTNPGVKRRIRIDPRQRGRTRVRSEGGKDEARRGSKVFKDVFKGEKNPKTGVTIEIGGTPVFIPNFDISPSPTKDQKPTKGQQTGSSRQRNRARTKPNRQMTPPRRTEPRTPARTSLPSSTTTTFWPPKTTPTPTPTLNTFSTTLTSFRALQSSLSSTRPRSQDPQVQTSLPRRSDPRVKTTRPRSDPVPEFGQSRQKTLNHKQSGRTTGQARRITPSPTPQPTSPITRPPNPPTTLQTRLTRPPPSPPTPQAPRQCPGTLETCVDSCIPLEDIYAYSACVVECGERC